MRIRLEHDGSVFEYERKPMLEGRFRALCYVAAAGLYVGLVIGVTALCGLPGLITMAILTFLVGLPKLMEF